MTKIIAFHLPQFHTIPENDEWWGEGFTEWTNAKKCTPIFNGHYQPKEPLNDHYYNLLDKSALQWQVDLAKKYGIYGFCFYHYWFKGKKLLEKPLEIYLANKELDLPFCFSWANHSWTRTWLDNQDMLMEMKYGEFDDWVKHFNFLLDYFKDDRYIKIDGKPIIMFNRPLDFDKADQMIECWNKLALENDLKGIYYIETLSGYQTDSVLPKSDALVESEPSYTYHFLPLWFRLFRKVAERFYSKSKPRFNLYGSFWKTLLKRKPLQSSKTVYPGALVNWDNAARRPLNASIFLSFSPAKFKKYLKQQIIRCKTVYKVDYLFLNAWNEWAEGNYLEPDKKYGHQLLESVRDSLKEVEDGQI
jgi:lipopolysaccharide biosynthesis protein